jgi:hypothetical protein
MFHRRSQRWPLFYLLFMACCTPALTGDLAYDLEDLVPLTAYRMFTTAGTYGVSSFTGTGLGQLDQACETEARAAGLTRRYRALATDSTLGLSVRFSLSKPIYMVNVSTPFLLITSLQDSISGQDLSAQPRYDAQGNFISSGSAQVMTGLTSTGENGENCTDWSATDFATKFTRGSMTVVDRSWIGSIASPTGCNSTSARLYCLGE